MQVTGNARHARTGSVTVSRNHVERLEDGTEVKLAAPADLGLQWAAA
jgi:hypothetical protein